MMKRSLKASALLGIALSCNGCSRAPSIDIIGSYFPVWMVCLTLGIILVYLLHYLLARFKLEQNVGPVALFYPSAVVLFTSLLWLIFFR